MHLHGYYLGGRNKRSFLRNSCYTVVFDKVMEREQCVTHLHKYGIFFLPSIDINLFGNFNSPISDKQLIFFSEQATLTFKIYNCTCLH